jgi:hypothetical protein
MYRILLVHSLIFYFMDTEGHNGGRKNATITSDIFAIPKYYISHLIPVIMFSRPVLCRLEGQRTAHSPMMENFACILSRPFPKNFF